MTEMDVKDYVSVFQFRQQNAPEQLDSGAFLRGVTRLNKNQPRGRCGNTRSRRFQFLRRFSYIAETMIWLSTALTPLTLRTARSTWLFCAWVFTVPISVALPSIKVAVTPSVDNT